MATIRVLAPGEVPVALLSNVLPAPLSGVASAGTSVYAARADHNHDDSELRAYVENVAANQQVVSDAAIAQIESDKTVAQSAIETDKTAALSAIATSRASAEASVTNIGNAKVTEITNAAAVAFEDQSYATFEAGLQFTPDLTTTLNLGVAYGNKANVIVHYDAAFQGPETFELSGTNIVFSEPIPSGVNRVYVRGGKVIDAGVSVPSDNSVTSAKIQDAAVTASKIADLNVTATKLADACVSAAKIAAGAILADKLADSSVATAKIADSAVSEQKIANGAILPSKLSAGAVTWTAAGDVTVSGDILFTKVGGRILGDFSNAAHNSRTLFQSSVLNGDTIVGAVPNGAGLKASFTMFNSSDAANASVFAMQCSDTESRVSSSKNGTGAFKPLNLYVSDALVMQLNTDKSVYISDYNNQSSGSPLVVRRNNSGATFNTAHVELQAQTGNVYLGFHASGNTAALLRHIRGEEGLGVTNSVNSAYAPIRASAFTVNSDYRVKENIVSLTGALDRISLLKPRRFNFIEGSMSHQGGITVDGFIAHEVESVVPEAVDGAKDDTFEDGSAKLQSLDQSKLVPLLTAALQELKAIVEAQALRIAALEGTA